jgi:heme O synthase-like polyprenyltransferase
MKITVFWDVTPCSLIYIYLCFGETCYFLLASLKVAVFIHMIVSAHTCSLNYKKAVDTKFKGAVNMLTHFSLHLSYVTFTNSVPTSQ